MLLSLQLLAKVASPPRQFPLSLNKQKVQERELSSILSLKAPWWSKGVLCEGESKFEFECRRTGIATFGLGSQKSGLLDSKVSPAQMRSHTALPTSILTDLNVSFEPELASQEESRHIFYHHASSISSIESPCGPPLPLPCFDSEPDSENFHRGLPGQHVIPFSMPLPLGKGAKGGFKSKQGVVRYIVIAYVFLPSSFDFSSLRRLAVPQVDQTQERARRRPIYFPLLSPCRNLPSSQPRHHFSSRSQSAGRHCLEDSLHGRKRESQSHCQDASRNLGCRSTMLRRCLR